MRTLPHIGDAVWLDRLCGGLIFGFLFLQQIIFMFNDFRLDLRAQDSDKKDASVKTAATLAAPNRKPAILKRGTAMF